MQLYIDPDHGVGVVFFLTGPESVGIGWGHDASGPVITLETPRLTDCISLTLPHWHHFSFPAHFRNLDEIMKATRFRRVINEADENPVSLPFEDSGSWYRNQGNIQMIFIPSIRLIKFIMAYLAYTRSITLAHLDPEKQKAFRTDWEQAKRAIQLGRAGESRLKKVAAKKIDPKIIKFPVRQNG